MIFFIAFKKVSVDFEQNNENNKKEEAFFQTEWKKIIIEHHIHSHTHFFLALSHIIWLLGASFLLPRVVLQLLESERYFFHIVDDAVVLELKEIH